MLGERLGGVRGGAVSAKGVCERPATFTTVAAASVDAAAAAAAVWWHGRHLAGPRPHSHRHVCLRRGLLWGVHGRGVWGGRAVWGQHDSTSCPSPGAGYAHAHTSSSSSRRRPHHDHHPAPHHSQAEVSVPTRGEWEVC